MIVPWLQRADWPHWRRAVCRSLVPRTFASPWVTIAEDRGETVEPLPADPDAEFEALEAQAIQFLRSGVAAAWKIVSKSKGLFGLGKRPTIVVHDGSAYAAAQIVDPAFLRVAQELLRSDHVLLAVPARDVLIAGTMDVTDELFAIVDRIFREHERPLSDLLFLANDGVLNGIAERTKGPPATRTLSRAQPGMLVRCSLATEDAARDVRTIVLERRLGERADPAIYSVDDASSDVDGNARWLDEALQRARSEVIAVWDDLVRVTWKRNDHGDFVVVTVPDHVRDPLRVAELLARLPFEVAGVSIERIDRALAIGPHRVMVGLGIAFRGTKHVVSQRFLDHGGPWRAFHAGDVTFLQMHDLDADDRTAQVQHHLALARLGDGLLPERSSQPVEGYARKDGSFDVVIGDAARLSQARLRDVCLARRAGDIGRPRVVFPRGRESAEVHLHELWLRELECIAIEGGVERRLDEGYTPPERSFVPPFPFTTSGREVLVLYPVYDDREEMRPGVRSLVLRATPPALREQLRSDKAPYCTVLSDEALSSIAAATNMSAIRDFIRETGAPYYQYQLEHDALAGDGTSRLRGNLAEEMSWPYDTDTSAR